MADNPLKYSDFLQADESISNFIKQLEQAQVTYAKMKDSIVGAAKDLEAGIKAVNNTTAAGQEATKKSATEADKLAKAHDDLAKSMEDTAKQIVELKRQQTEQNNVNKLTAKLNASTEGSYDRLSAQYALNKIALNKLSAEQRAAGTSGGELETQTAALYEEMKRLQAVTGQNQLNVGNYAEATQSLTSIVKANAAELTRMAMAGESGTKAYQDLLVKTAMLKDEIGDTKAAIKNMASDTATLDSVMAGAAAAGGGFAVFTGGMELFGGESKNVEKAQKTLQSAIAITTGLQTLQNAVQADGALMLGLTKIQSYAVSKAEVYRRLIQIQGTSATVGATVAQKAFNAVASANPYVLLAMALVTVVGALALFAFGTESAAEKQQKANDAQKAYLDYLQVGADRLAQQGAAREKAAQQELNDAKARGAGTREMTDLESNLADIRKANHKNQLDYYAKEVNNLALNKEKLFKYREELAKIQEQQSKGVSKVYVDFELNGQLTKAKTEEAIKAIQGKIDSFGKQVEIGTTLVDRSAEIAAADADMAAKRLEQRKAFEKADKDLARKAEDEKIKLIANSYEQQRASISASYVRQIADLQYQLANDKNLTAKGRESINSTIISYRLELTKDLKELDNKEAADLTEIRRKSQDLQISIMEEGFAKQRVTTTNEYDRQIEDLKTRIATERGLTEEQISLMVADMANLATAKTTALAKINNEEIVSEAGHQKELTDLKLAAVKEGTLEELALKLQSIEEQRKVEIAQNNLKTKDLKQSEADINAKYDAMSLKESDASIKASSLRKFDQQQALAASEFDLLRSTEAEKTQFKLEQEKERIKKILELNKMAGVKLSDAEVKTMENTIARLDKEINASKQADNDIYSALGLKLNEDQKSKIAESTDYAIGQIQNMMQSEVDAKQVAVDAANSKVDATKTALEAEIEARNNGYASNVALAQKELDNAKKNQAKALAEQQKAQKAQELLNTALQASSLVTASAGIWKSFTTAGLGPFGVALALAAMGLMWGSFAAAKVKASQVTKQSYGEGGLEFLEGGSHASGNDIQIGTTSSGKDRRAEGGEALAIIRKSQTQKYRRLLPSIIDSLNKGTFEQKYGNSYENGISLSVSQSNVDLSKIESGVNDIKKQGERRYYTDGNGRTVEVYKNLKRVYVN